MAGFKDQNSFSFKLYTSNKIRSAYPDRVPVIVERHKGSRLPLIDKNKFLCPIELSGEKFISEIRKHITLTPGETLFIFVDNSIFPKSNMMGQIYNKYKNDDGFLYVTYREENTFG